MFARRRWEKVFLGGEHGAGCPSTHKCCFWPLAVQRCCTQSLSQGCEVRRVPSGSEVRNVTQGPDILHPQVLPIGGAQHFGAFRVGEGGGARKLQTPTPRDALEGKGPPRRPQRRLGRRLEEVAEAVGGGYCWLQMPLRLAMVLVCLPLAAPIGLPPLHILWVRTCFGGINGAPG